MPRDRGVVSGFFSPTITTLLSSSSRLFMESIASSMEDLQTITLPLTPSFCQTETMCCFKLWVGLNCNITGVLPTS